VFLATEATMETIGVATCLADGLWPIRVVVVVDLPLENAQVTDLDRHISFKSLTTPKGNCLVLTHASDEGCTNHKFMTHLDHRRPLGAWARVMYLLASPHMPGVGQWEHAWIFEDDCRFASVKSLAAFIAGRKTDPAHLVACGYSSQVSRPTWMHWHLASGYDFGKPVSPLWKTFCPAIRVSKALVEAVAETTLANKKGAFVEVLLVNVALARGMKTSALDPSIQRCMRVDTPPHVDWSSVPFAHAFKNYRENLARLQAA
jgi:hypothetical protein